MADTTFSSVKEFRLEWTADNAGDATVTTPFVDGELLSAEVSGGTSAGSFDSLVTFDSANDAPYSVDAGSVGSGGNPDNCNVYASYTETVTIDGVEFPYDPGTPFLSIAGTKITLPAACTVTRIDVDYYQNVLGAGAVALGYSAIDHDGATINTVVSTLSPANNTWTAHSFNPISEAGSYEVFVFISSGKLTEPDVRIDNIRIYYTLGATSNALTDVDGVDLLDGQGATVEDGDVITSGMLPACSVLTLTVSSDPYASGSTFLKVR